MLRPISHHFLACSLRKGRCAPSRGSRPWAKKNFRGVCNGRTGKRTDCVVCCYPLFLRLPVNPPTALGRMPRSSVIPNVSYSLGGNMPIKRSASKPPLVPTCPRTVVVLASSKSTLRFVILLLCILEVVGSGRLQRAPPWSGRTHAHKDWVVMPCSDTM